MQECLGSFARHSPGRSLIVLISTQCAFRKYVGGLQGTAHMRSCAPVTGVKALADSAATASRGIKPVPPTAQTSALAASSQQGAGGKPPPAPPTRAYEGPPMQKLKLKLRMKPAAAAAQPPPAST